MCMICSLRNSSDLLAALDQHLDGGGSAGGDGAMMSLGSINPLTETTDASETVGTPYTLQVGQSFFGTIASSTDSDWVQIDLVQGVSYDFRLLGFGLNFNVDPQLRLRDADGLQITSDDDGFSSNSSTHETDSALTFTATYTGTYYLEADSFSTSTGGYILSATLDPAEPTLLPGGSLNPLDTVFTLDEMAWQLVNNGAAYFAGVEGAPFNVGVDKALTVNITALTAEGQFLARQALLSWTAVTGIAFTEVASSAEIVFDDNQTGAFAQPFYTGQSITSASVNVGTDWLAEFGTTLASYSFETYIHEIGHALGLGHAGNYNGTATFGINNYYANDSLAWTIMSYMQAENDELVSVSGSNTVVGASFRYIFTPQIVDIIAIQRLYGDVGTAFAGNTTYGVGGNTGLAAIDGAINSGALLSMTIWDEGGIDTLNFSTAAVAQDIDLTDGTLSSVMGGVFNLGIARGVVIENVIGGSGSDSITGNAANNILNGGTGADALIGGAGNDTFVTDGGDPITEAANGGTDQVNSSVSHTLGLNLENLVLTGGAAINGTGNTLANRITGNAANNILNGGTGADALIGGAGADTLIGGAGRDVLHGGSADGARDVFVFNTVSESRNGATARDIIFNFVAGIDDIRLTGIDANTALAGNQAFAWAGATAHAHAVWIAASGTNVVVRGDINGDLVSDFQIQIAGITSVAARDFLL